MKPIDLLLIPMGGSVLFGAACVLEFILNGVLGFVVIAETGFGVPFRFLWLGLGMLSSTSFLVSKFFLDWLIWCLVFVPLFYVVRALIRAFR